MRLGRAANWLLRKVGYELRKRPQRHVEPITSNPDFAEVFDKTEGMIDLAVARLLYELAKDVRAGCILEVGSYRGRSTVALGLGSLNGRRPPVYAIEPHETFQGLLGGRFGPGDRAAFYRAMLETGCYEVVRLINVSSEVIAPGWTHEIGLLWIDGDHSYQGVKRDVACWLPHLAGHGLIVFDDTLDPSLGPHQVITEMIQTHGFEVVRRVGSVAVLHRGI
jgi:predicted O-methyltransferase YrrM